MKKTVKNLLTMAVITLSVIMRCFTPAFAEQQPQVLVGSESFGCIIEDSRTYIPMRAVFEALGFNVDWLAEDKAVKLSKDGTELTLYTKTSAVTGYGELKNKVIIRNDRTYLPFRELLNILGYEVDWIAETKTAVVVLPDTETTAETTTETTTSAVTTTEAATETTTDIIYDNELYIGDTPVNSKQELVDAVLENIKNNKPTVEELIALVSADDEEAE